MGAGNQHKILFIEFLFQFGFVPVDASHYSGSGICYQGFCLMDTTGCSIAPYFRPAAQFISAGLRTGGRVMVNCQMGVSRCHYHLCAEI